jgi:hypothetical protein
MCIPLAPRPVLRYNYNVYAFRAPRPAYHDHILKALLAPAIVITSLCSLEFEDEAYLTLPDARSIGST